MDMHLHGKRMISVEIESMKDFSRILSEIEVTVLANHGKDSPEMSVLEAMSMAMWNQLRLIEHQGK